MFQAEVRTPSLQILDSDGVFEGDHRLASRVPGKRLAHVERVFVVFAAVTAVVIQHCPVEDEYSALTIVKSIRARS